MTTDTSGLMLHIIEHIICMLKLQWLLDIFLLALIVY